MTVTFQHERYSEAFCKELLPLIKANWRESSSYEAGIEVDPSFPRYQKLDAADVCVCFTARDDGKLVGYVVYIVTASRKHRAVLCGFGEALYMGPEHRGHGPQLLTAAHQALIARGVRRLGWLVDEGSTLQQYLIACEFYRDEVMMEKKLCA